MCSRTGEPVGQDGGSWLDDGHREQGGPPEPIRTKHWNAAGLPARASGSNIASRGNGSRRAPGCRCALRAPTPLVCNWRALEIHGLSNSAGGGMCGRLNGVASAEQPWKFSFVWFYADLPVVGTLRGSRVVHTSIAC